MAAGLPMMMGGLRGPQGWPQRRALVAQLLPNTCRASRVAPRRAPEPGGPGIRTSRDISGLRKIPDKRTRAPRIPPAIVYLPTNGHEKDRRMTGSGRINQDPGSDGALPLSSLS